MSTSGLVFWLAEYSLQIALVLGIGLPLPWLLRVQDPRLRLIFLQSLLGILVCLPLIPPFSRPLVSAAGLSEISIETTHLITAPADHWTGWIFPALVVIWMTGAIGRLVVLGVGYRVLQTYRANSPVYTAVPQGLSTARSDVDIRVCERVMTPVSFGWKRPVILLPRRFERLPECQKRAVLCHELIHLERSDWPVVILEQCIRSLLWFHPAVHLLLDRIDLTREQSIDFEVVRLTRAANSYLQALYSFAKTFRQTSVGPMIPLIRQGHLKQRVALLRQEVFMSNARRFSVFLVMFVVVAATALIAASTIGASSGSSTAAVSTSGSTSPPQEGEKKEGANAVVDAKDVKIRLVKKVNPVYPEEAKKQGLTGNVILTLKIGKDGKVLDVTVKESVQELLDQSAVDAVRQWEYSPPVLEGEPVEVLATVTIAFKLN